MMDNLYNMNIYPAKILSGMFAGYVGVYTQNLLPLFIAVLVFETIDFITGCWKSSVIAHRRGRKFAFESIKAWRTIYKIVFIMVGIVLAEILDTIVSEERLRLANIFTAFTCGVEFWSFLENAAVISNHPIFRWLRKYMQNRVEQELGATINDMKDGNDK